MRDQTEAQICRCVDAAHRPRDTAKRSGQKEYNDHHDRVFVSRAGAERIHSIIKGPFFAAHQQTDQKGNDQGKGSRDLLKGLASIAKRCEKNSGTQVNNQEGCQGKKRG